MDAKQHSVEKPSLIAMMNLALYLYLLKIHMLRGVEIGKVVYVR